MKHHNIAPDYLLLSLIKYNQFSIQNEAFSQRRNILNGPIFRSVYGLIYNIVIIKGGLKT